MMMMDNWSYLAALSVLVLSLLAGFRVEDQPGVMCHLQGGGTAGHYHHHPTHPHHHYLLRPVPSDTLPLVELREDPDPVLDPRDKDLNETELRAALGAHFDPAFMSVSSPPPPAEKEQQQGMDTPDSSASSSSSSDSELNSSPRQPSSSSSNQKQPSGLMPKEIKAMDFEHHHHLHGGSSSKKAHSSNKPSKKLRRRLQLWLWSHAHCPVAHAWSDLGARFWPRYVRAGGCGGHNGGRSCSVPEGMLCRPARSHHVTILRWRCVTAHKNSGNNSNNNNNNNNNNKPLRCAWIPVQYPVISECKCSCPN